MVFIFTFLNKDIIQNKIEILSTGILNLLLSPFEFIIPQDADEAFLIFPLILGITYVTLQFYLLAKICGLFKRLRGLNFFLSLLILIITDFTVHYLLGLHLQLNPFKIFYDSSGGHFPVSILFFLYKYFDIMGQYCPKTFGKIGYYTSIEFYRELFLKFKKNFRWY